MWRAPDDQDLGAPRQFALRTADHVLPPVSIRQWVLAFPWPLRLLLSTRPEAVTRVLAIVTRAIETALIRRAGLTRKSGAYGGIVTLTYPARFNASGVR